MHYYNKKIKKYIFNKIYFPWQCRGLLFHHHQRNRHVYMLKCLCVCTYICVSVLWIVCKSGSQPYWQLFKIVYKQPSVLICKTKYSNI